MIICAIIIILVITISYFIFFHKKNIVMVVMNDQEGWLESSVLLKLGYPIKRCIFYENLLEGIEEAKLKYPNYNILVCGHTSADSFMLIEPKNKYSKEISIHELKKKYGVKWVATCFWDIDQDHKTPYQNSPGFTKDGKSCHYVTNPDNGNDMEKYELYLHWLNEFKTKLEKRNITPDQVALVHGLYMQEVMPKILAHEDANGQEWAFQKLNYYLS